MQFPEPSPYREQSNADHDQDDRRRDKQLLPSEVDARFSVRGRSGGEADQKQQKQVARDSHTSPRLTLRPLLPISNRSVNVVDPG